MKNTYRIEKVDHLNYTEEDWQRYYDFRVKSFALKGEPMPFDSVEQLKKLNVENITKRGEELYIAWKNEVENGMFFFSTSFKDDLEKRFTFLENYMNDRQLEAHLLEMIFQRFMDYDETSNSLVILSRDGMNDFVEDLYDAEVGANSVLYELEVKEANVEKIETWLAEAPAKFPHLRIAFYDEIPDELLEDYAALYQEMLDDIPVPTELGETTMTAASAKSYQEAFKLRNYCIYNYLIFNEANQLIALTNVSINLKDPQTVEQALTGVQKEYRGNGLSKWLKAAMFKKLTTSFSELETIETETHPENHPSRELSKQMGYKVMGTEKSLLISRENIAQHLKSQS